MIYSLKILVRLVILILSSIILSLTTTPIELSDALENIFRPLKKLKFPVHEFSLMISISLRFIPTIAEEFDRIKKAQMSRGADFEQGKLISKVKSLVTIFVPVFISAFKRADELATAMEARCYRGDIERSKLKSFKLKSTDFIGIFIFCIYLVIYLLIKLYVS